MRWVRLLPAEAEGIIHAAEVNSRTALWVVRGGEQRGQGSQQNGLGRMKTESVHAAASEEFRVRGAGELTHVRGSAVGECTLGLRLRSLI